MTIGIQVVSSHPLLIRAVEKTLADITDFPILPSASHEAEVTRDTGFPRLFVLDACSLHTDLGPLAERCRSRSPGSKFLALLPTAGRNYADAIRLFYWGIDGFVELHETWQTELLHAIRSILNGQLWVPPEVVAAFVAQAKALQERQFLPGHSLTAREAQVLQLLMRHLTNKEISKALLISERTVKFHVSHILGKLGLQDRRRLLPETFY
jgi:DNA-binding NarL/FixJ family response regulator